MKKDKIEIVKQESSDKKCYICNGIGIRPDSKRIGKIETDSGDICKACNGTGTFKDNHYILIVNDMAWSMDTIK